MAKISPPGLGYPQNGEPPPRTAPEEKLQQALAHHQLGELAEAARLYRALLIEAPVHFDALHLLGVVNYQRGQHEDAIASFERALALKPDHAETLVNRGVALQELGRHEDAVASYERALTLQPDDARALYNRGNALRKLERHPEALASYDRALALEPEHARALYNRGNALRDLGRDEDAIASYDRALAVQPEYAEALSNRGNALLALNRHEDALASFDRALALDPDYAEALSNRGNALRELRRYEEALASYDRALTLTPDNPDVINNRGNVLRDLKRYEEAAKSFERLNAIAPGHEYALGEWLACLLTCCAWEDVERHLERLAKAVTEGQKAATPFSFLLMSQSGAAQLQCARTFVADKYPAVAKPLRTGERYRHDRIRLAYLSANFHNHPQSCLMAELFELHDKARFDVTAISFGPDVQDEMRERLQGCFERFIDVGGKSDREVAHMLREQEIDIAIDLKGFTRDCRPGIFAHRAAPVQINYLDYPGTTGAEYVDYILADARVIPVEHEAFYSEKVVRLPDSYQVNDSRRAIAEHTPSRAEVGLPNAGFVFCCFNNNYKITSPVFDIWMHLLEKVEGSVLWLLEDNLAASRNLRREAERRDVRPDRLVFAPRLPLPTHLARHRLADLFLDTLPCNAHTTASDALWAGLPVLTCMGGAFAARVAGSLLHAVGLPELITQSLEEYEALALKLATTPAVLIGIKAKLARNRKTYPLFDTERYRSHIESVYITMWERCQRGEPPAGFAVQPIR